MNALLTLLRRLLSKEQRRFIKFCVVGGSGVPVNLLVTWLTYTYAFSSLGEDLRKALCYIAGIAVSIFTNFLLNDLWTWRDREKTGSSFVGRLVRFYMVCAVAAVLQFGAAMLLSRIMHYLLSQFFGIALATVVNYVVNNLWTYRRRPPASSDAPPAIPAPGSPPAEGSAPSDSPPSDAPRGR